jgi:hypothetical protein
MPQLGEAQPGGELAVVAEAPFAVKQQRQPFGMGEPFSLGIGGKFAERSRHAGQPHRVQSVEGGMLQHHDLLQ